MGAAGGSYPRVSVCVSLAFWEDTELVEFLLISMVVGLIKQLRFL